MKTRESLPSWQRLFEPILYLVFAAIVLAASLLGYKTTKQLSFFEWPMMAVLAPMVLLRAIYSNVWLRGKNVWVRPLVLAVLLAAYVFSFQGRFPILLGCEWTFHGLIPIFQFQTKVVGLTGWKTWPLLFGWNLVVTALAVFPNQWKKALVISSLVAFSVAFMFPFAWLLLTAVKPDSETMHVPIIWIPSEYHFENFKSAVIYGHEALGYYPFVVYAINTIVLCALIVAGTVASNSIVAYSFARLRWPGRDFAFALTLATMMVPFPILMVPTFALFRHLDWIGTYRPLWVPAWFGSAFSIFLLRQFFRTIPFELTEAAKLDGASEWRIFRTIVLPLSKASLAVVALFAFMGSWNDFLGPLIYLLDQHTFTLSLGLQAYQSQNGGTSWNLVMAASAMVIAPVIILFFFTQRLFIQGIAITGLKG